MQKAPEQTLAAALLFRYNVLSEIDRSAIWPSRPEDQPWNNPKINMPST